LLAGFLKFLRDGFQGIRFIDLERKFTKNDMWVCPFITSNNDVADGEKPVLNCVGPGMDLVGRKDNRWIG
jgi:hypothetical protein